MEKPVIKKRLKTIFSCQSCGYQSLKWLGKCPECGNWDSFAEEVARPETVGTKRYGSGVTSEPPVPVNAITFDPEERLKTRIEEFDRVLGGGLVPGSLVLIGGDPGIGKSTLMLQALHGLGNNGRKVLYVSGEESVRQIGLRSQRLDALSPRVFIMSEIDLELVLATVSTHRPDVLVIDSIQTMYNADLPSAPGSVSQVRESAMRLMVMAKKTGIPTFLVGHVTKDGAIAGPRLLEHMVDTVLYFEGDSNHVFRILRAVKNRFGSTNEIGVFEMKEMGLAEVSNPSAIFLAERPKSAPGSVVTCGLEGTRPILVEFQALVSGTSFGTPRRTILGLDQNRVALLAAVIEKKLGMHLMGQDIFMNVAGGVKVDEPAADLAIVTAIMSSFLDKPVAEGTIVLGEVGLAGEIRAIGQVENRLAEIVKMGFTRCLLPKTNVKRSGKTEGIALLGVDAVSEAAELLF